MISVIIPVYNAIDYLEECFASLEKQHYPLFEVVLVDDGSTDGSSELCDELALRGVCVKVIHQSNGGQQAARSAGVMGSSGDYVMFLDSDDCLRSDALGIISTLVGKEPYDIVCFDYARGVTLNYEKGVLGDSLLVPGAYSGSEYDAVFSAVCSGEFNNLATKAVKKEIALKALDCLEGIEGLRHGEDLLYLVSIVEHAKSLYCLPDVLYFYRENPNSMSSCFSETQISDLSIVFHFLTKTASSWGAKYEKASKCAAIKHYYWVLMSLNSSGLGPNKKRECVASIASGVESVCGRETRARISDLRVDFRLPMNLAISGKWRAALFAVGVVERLARIGSHCF